jgi:hypothetical protein
MIDAPLPLRSGETVELLSTACVATAPLEEQYGESSSTEPRYIVRAGPLDQ